MLRKTTAAVVLAGALALGTASATSLGPFNSPTFAASSVSLLDCNVGDPIDFISLVPETQTVGESVTGAGATLDLGVLDITALTAELTAINAACVTGTVLDLVLLDSSDAVLDVVSGIDADGVGLDAVSVADGIDIISIDEIRVVLRSV